MSNDSTTRDPRAGSTSGAPLTRRKLLIGGAVIAVSTATACAGERPNHNDPDGGADGGADAGADADAGTDAGTAVDGGSDSGTNRAPVWTPIPAQVWVVGVPVLLDLAHYCTDPDGDALTFSLETTLPAGLTLTGSVISGTPTVAVATTQVTVTSDDGA